MGKEKRRMKATIREKKKQLRGLNSRIARVEEKIAELKRAKAAMGPNLNAVLGPIDGLQRSPTTIERALARKGIDATVERSFLDGLKPDEDGNYNIPFEAADGIDPERVERALGDKDEVLVKVERDGDSLRGTLSDGTPIKIGSR